ncbi:hypothetical protein [Aquimarina algicola]|uniref:Uncharacterized protein n=1 Tax=Aquimarina algicola TaxID=2589995 RepID=A0A504JJF9_9FLAO|nr:hypothetical protein [Aquimarina algicola]TPN86889.1 hypothetical protein FHK87_04605 [Aquimarina algicola]
MEKGEFVRMFFEDVFINDKSLDEISEKYRYKGSKIKSKDEANEMFKKHIEFLKSEKEHLLERRNGFKVETYENSSRNNLLPFEKNERKNIYVVSVADNIESYILMKESKIISLLYFRKGSDSNAYFIPYYAKSEY